ncbi:MAG: nucleotidyltransferase domain-containing protein [Acidobacteria bacterium]|jgi:predicted nucleotidyltransferase|nr:nucleotidyltransferase domain-containing protein [Acidobacteriota bacterium]MBA4183504.1 nucleotidyltransferase domain-containing protein [Acidobacteriota bacterium]HEV8157992.1 nucleotidyltransferase domain-containing protein [Pyrinomonadaceae bacterium]
MNINTQIKNLCRQIVENFNPQKIILFGSHAYGEPTADSDVDLLVVMPFEGSDAHKAIEILLNLKTGVPLDLLVRTSEQIRERIEMEDFFMREIINKGKLLYESNNTGMD